MAARRRSKRKPTAARRTRRSFPLVQLLVVIVVIVAAYLAYLDIIVREQFEGKRWALSARVFARPMELYVGRPLLPAQLEQELARLGYHSVSDPKRPGEFKRRGTSFTISTRGFTFWDGVEAPQQLQLEFGGNWITSLSDRGQGKEVDVARLDPLQIASIYPSKQEDRQLVKLTEVPPLLIQTLMAVEDRSFYEHHGISPRSLLRATVANVRAGGVVQGGSTLTQQLVKNFFLSNERTLQRKINEAGMSLLLELHYSKDEILEAYLNEVYLGQDGSRAVHGLGLASQFYFERPLDQLEPDQFALLVGMIKGPSYYDPRRNPERAKVRRDLVLDALVETAVLTPEAAKEYKAKPLGVLKRPAQAVNAHPAFLDMVRRQLREEYREEDLTSEGLRIFTTLDPLAQSAAEAAVSKRLARIEKDRGLKSDSLQGAFIATAIDSGEILALVGDRNPRMAGFNRVLDALRPIGSLVKPAVYLTALMQPQRYTTASLLDDTPLRMRAGDGRDWSPENYDRQFRGRVLLFDALVHSYNVPTVRLGIDVGPERVVDTLRKLGVTGELNPYPALMLGAADLTLMDVTRMYQTLAAGGFRSPLRAIRAVLDVNGTPLQSYPLRVEQVLDADQVFLVNAIMQAVATEGTAKMLGARFGMDSGIAGKTGTTNDKRDSWFAGFTGNQVAVAWVGRDDNKSMGLSGASGAVPVWSDYMAEVGVQPLTLSSSERIEWLWIDRSTGLRADGGCPDRVQLPFITGSAPQTWSSCARGDLSQPIEWLKGLIR